MRTWITRVLYSFGVGVLCTQLLAQTLNEAKKLYNEGQYAEAKPVFEKLVKQSPSNSSYNLWYGACCFETGEMDKAEKYLSFSVKRRQIEAFRYMGELNYRKYRFEDAVDMYEQYIKFLEQKKRDTEQAELRLDLLEDALRMMERVENVQIIDSIIVDKENFLSAYTLSEEMGQLSTYADFFQEPSVLSDVFMNQKGDKIHYARPVEGQYELFTKSRLMEDWADEKQLTLNSDLPGDNNYPFVMPDGVTLYFASKGNNSLGGYDLFVTRYNMNTDTYLAPEQLGMPFNSPYNDYMMVYDEVKGLGWFVSDRFQPEGQACVYLFIPNPEHNRVETEDIEVKRARASIRSIRDSWEEGAHYAELIQLAHQEIPYGKPKIEKDFEFVIQDNKVYYTWDDIKSPEAKTLYRKVVSTQKEIQTLEKKLDALRMDYTLAASPDRKEQLGETILSSEERLNNLLPQVAELEKQARNAEVKYIRSKR